MTTPTTPSTVEQRLHALGVTLSQPTTPLAVYRPAVRSGAYIYVSGQLATRDGAVPTPGRLGDSVSVEQGELAAQLAAINVLAVVRALHGTLEGLRLVRLVGYVAATPEFDQHPAVVNGASRLLRDALGEELGVGARLALGVASLPLRSPVEIEALFEVVASA
ncbi:MAG: RidA family protein [Dehalococcoidia bacterium]|nr:RidA family protein [Dehalococcoidia bacterium]